MIEGKFSPSQLAALESHIEALRELFRRADKQEDLRKKLALATKSVKDAMDGVEREFAVLDALLDDTPPPAVADEPFAIKTLPTGERVLARDYDRFPGPGSSRE